MKSLRVLVLASAATFGGISPGLAQNTPSAESLAAAWELASLTSASVVTQISATLTNETWPTVEAALRVKNPRIDPATLATLRREFEDLQARATLEALADAAPIYARHFTAEELRQLIAFYRTPVGAKALAVMPRASLELLQGMGPRLQRLSETVNQRFAAILQQRGYNP
jgi:hypothetical protein